MVKEKITDQPFLLVLDGPSCAGKSAVSDVLFERYGNLYKAKNDVIKWLFSDYLSLTHRRVVHDMVLATMRIALANGYAVIKEGAQFERETYAEIAAAAGVPLYVANIEAPWEVLEQRFEQRIEAKKQGVKKIANVDPVRFRELYDMYQSGKMKTDLVFDSSKERPEDIAASIVQCIKKQ